MRLLVLVTAGLLLAGCSSEGGGDGSPEDEGGAPDAPVEGDGGRVADLSRSAETGVTTYTCQGEAIAAVGTGESFVFKGLTAFCPTVDLSPPAGELFRSGRLVMAWSQPTPTMTDAYVELFEGDQRDVVASGSSNSSPVVVEFRLDGRESLHAGIHYGGTGLAADFTAAITLELFTAEAPPPAASGSL